MENRSAVRAHDALLIGLITFAVAGSVGMLLAQNYPHAFPRNGTVKLFDNDRVTIWEVNWVKGPVPPIHRHLYDMAGVYLRFGQVSVTGPDVPIDPNPKPGRPFDVPRPYYQPKGITHRETPFGAQGDPERLAIMVDLKDVTLPPLEPKPGMNPAWPREGAKDVLDNSRVVEWDYTWPTKKPLALHRHERDSVEVFVEGGTLVTKMADGHEETKTVAFKDARFVPRGQVDTEEAVSGSPRAIVIEIK